jgi:hypothetical protein
MGHLSIGSQSRYKRELLEIARGGATAEALELPGCIMRAALRRQPEHWQTLAHGEPRRANRARWRASSSPRR